MYNGIINVYKEKGYTSHDVVAKLRGILHQKKIGHTGTLDPDAVGVLPVCLGSGTKLCDMLTDKDKVYEAVLLLGKKTDTQDISGTVLFEQEVAVTEDEVVTAICSFVGEIMQVPPMYSALKVDGKKLCNLAREGITVERKARPVTIYSIDILKIDLPRVTMRVHCSKGTYIRTLCEDIGDRLSCGGCMEQLTRTRVGRFEIAESKTLTQIEEMVAKETFPEFVTDVEEMFTNCEDFHVKAEWDRLLWNGNPLKAEWLMEDKKLNVGANYRVYSHKGEFMGIYEYRENQKMIYPVKIFGRKQE